MIWNQLQNLIAQQRSFLIQNLITEQSAQINAEIVAKAKEAKTFKCTFEGTIPYYLIMKLISIFKRMR